MTNRGPRRPRPPDVLGDAGRAFWRSVVADYELSAPELLMLHRVCATVDVLALIDAELAVAGIMSEGSMGQAIPNRLLAAKVQQEQVLDVMVRAMSLPFPSEEQGRYRSRVASAAAAARWGV